MEAWTIAQSVQDLVMEGPLLLAGLIAIAAGALSFFSPCCLPLVPGYLSYVAGLTGEDLQQAQDSQESGAAAAATMVRPVERVRGRTVWGAVLFVVGFAAVFTAYGALFGSLGAVLIIHQDTLIRGLGVVTIVLGLLFTGVLWRIPGLMRSVRLDYRPRAGLAGAPLVGVMFGIGWTPCIGPTLAAVLTLATSTGDAGRGAALSLAYSIGLGIPFILAAAGVQRFMGSIEWARRHARGIMRFGGGMLILLGILQVTGTWTAIISRMQGLIAGWTPPL